MVLAWHAMVVGYVGAYLTITYLRGHYDAREDSLWNYLLPVTVVQVRMRWVGGWGEGGLAEVGIGKS